jgi:hypothetical protein
VGQLVITLSRPLIQPGKATAGIVAGAQASAVMGLPCSEGCNYLVEGRLAKKGNPYVAASVRAAGFYSATAQAEVRGRNLTSSVLTSKRRTALMPAKVNFTELPLCTVSQPAASATSKARLNWSSC